MDEDPAGTKGPIGPNRRQLDSRCQSSRPQSFRAFCASGLWYAVAIVLVPVWWSVSYAQEPIDPRADSVKAREIVQSRTLVNDRLLVQDSVEKGLRYLRARQQGGGSIGARYKVAVSSLAGLSILGAGHLPGQGPHSRTLVDCVGYLEGVARTSNYLNESGDGESRMHGHCYAILFLTQVAGTLPKEKEESVGRLIERGVRVIEGAQSSEGGWYYDAKNNDKDEASVTVCALQAMRAARNVGAHVDSFRIKQALRYVKRCQHPDGSVAYSLKEPGRRTFALTAAAVSTLNAAGVYESNELHKGLHYLRRQLARYPTAPWRAAEQEYPYYANLYTAQALYQDAGELWEQWYPAVRKHLLSKQRRDGSWPSNFGDEYGTAMALLILEVPLGYLPIFQR